MIVQLIEFSVGLAITISLGCGIKKLLEKIVPKLEKPETINEEDWNALTYHFEGGKWIGFFERLLSLVSFWMSEFTIIAGWFAFKVAAKWEVWKNIIQFPSTLDNIQPLIWYKTRKAIGSWILTRFLIGTLVNVLIGSIAAYAGSHLYEFVAFVHRYCKQ